MLTEQLRVWDVVNTIVVGSPNASRDSSGVLLIRGREQIIGLSNNLQHFSQIMD